MWRPVCVGLVGCAFDFDVGGLYPWPGMTRTEPLRIGALVSGGGRTVLNLHQRIRSGGMNAVIAVVISSRAAAVAVERCRAAGLPMHVVERKRLTEDVFCGQIEERLREAEVELVCMAGFLSFWRIPEAFRGRVVNIHPALLPDFGGKGFYGDRVHEAVLAAGVTESGCTVHFADNIYDHGPVILQKKVPVLPGDTVKTLGDRVFGQELIAMPEAVAMIADGRVALPCVGL